MTIRRQPEDFLVDERVRPDFESSLHQTREPGCAHAVYHLTKTSLTTPEAVQRAARALGARPGSESYAGLKDRHARTTQLMSIEVARAGTPPTRAEGPGWSCEFRGWTSGPVDASAIEGNRFTIVVRGLTAAAVAEMDRRAVLLADGDVHPRALLVVNYFGDQRFGSARHGGGFIARRLIEGDFDGSLRLAIGTPARKDTGSKRAFTRACAGAWGRWSELLPALPRCPERRAIEALAAGAGARDAFALLPRFTQTMAVEAYQSHLWNTTARGLAEQLGGVHPPLRTPDDFGEMVFPPAHSLAQDVREMIVPIPGPRTVLEGPWAEAARAAFAGEGIEPSRLRIPGLRRPFFGEAPRPLIARAERFDLGPAVPDELAPRGARLKRTVSFDLGRGSYATVVLRALGQ